MPLIQASLSDHLHVLQADLISMFLISLQINFILLRRKISGDWTRDPWHREDKDALSNRPQRLAGRAIKIVLEELKKLTMPRSINKPGQSLIKRQNGEILTAKLELHETSTEKQKLNGKNFAKKNC